MMGVCRAVLLFFEIAFCGAGIWLAIVYYDFILWYHHTNYVASSCLITDMKATGESTGSLTVRYGNNWTQSVKLSHETEIGCWCFGEIEECYVNTNHEGPESYRNNKEFAFWSDVSFIPPQMLLLLYYMIVISSIICLILPTLIHLIFIATKCIDWTSLPCINNDQNTQKNKIGSNKIGFFNHDHTYDTFETSSNNATPRNLKQQQEMAYKNHKNKTDNKDNKDNKHNYNKHEKHHKRYNYKNKKKRKKYDKGQYDNFESRYHLSEMDDESPSIAGTSITVRLRREDNELLKNSFYFLALLVLVCLFVFLTLMTIWAILLITYNLPTIDEIYNIGNYDNTIVNGNNSNFDRNASNLNVNKKYFGCNVSDIINSTYGTKIIKYSSNHKTTNVNKFSYLWITYVVNIYQLKKQNNSLSLFNDEYDEYGEYDEYDDLIWISTNKTGYAIESFVENTISNQFNNSNDFNFKRIGDFDFCYKSKNFENQFQFNKPKNEYILKTNHNYAQLLIIMGYIFLIVLFCIWFCVANQFQSFCNDYCSCCKCCLMFINARNSLCESFKKCLWCYCN